MIEPRHYTEGSVYASVHGEWGGETYQFDGLQEAADEAYQAYMENAFPNVRVWWTEYGNSTEAFALALDAGPHRSVGYILPVREDD